MIHGKYVCITWRPSCTYESDGMSRKGVYGMRMKVVPYLREGEGEGGREGGRGC
jgi:hypothetical protein